MALIIFSAVFFIALDRFLKIFALSFLAEKPIEIFGDLFKLNLAKNENIAFSIPINFYLILIINIIIVIVLLIFLLKLIKKQAYWPVLYLTNIEFGAISNIWDRLHYGYVIDYFDLKYFTVFNIADCMIVIYTLLLIIYLYKKGEVVDVE